MAAVGAVVVVAASAVAARAETVEVPRDVGTLPRANFDWVETPGIADHPAGDVLIVPRESLRLIEGYDLRGRLLWRYPLPAGETFEGTAAAGDLVALASDRHVTAVERRSGRRRWLWTPERGSVVGDLQARAATLIVRVDLAAPAGENGWRVRRAFVLLDAASGRALWRTECPDRMCTLVENAGDDLLVDVGGGFLRLDPATGAPGRRVERRGKLVAAGGGVALDAWAPETGSLLVREHGPIELTALPVSGGQGIWKATLGPGDPTDLAIRRMGDVWVALSPGRLDVLDAATGALRRSTRLPDVASFDRHLGVLPDGRVAALVRTGQWRPPLSFVLVVDPAGPRAPSLWSLADDRSRVRLVPRSARPLFDQGEGFGLLRAEPDPAPRSKEALTDEVKRRVEHLMKEAAAAPDVLVFAQDSLDLRVLHRFDRAAYEGAAIARLDDAAPAELRGLARLLEAPPVTPASRAALSRTLDRTVAELPRAPRPRQLELLDAALSLFEALPGQLPERPLRDVGSQLGAIVRETMAGRPSEAARTPVLHAARRYLDLLWRAPYADLDGPLRAAVAAVGHTTTATAACPPAKPALSEQEAIWADLAWDVLGLGTSDEPQLLQLPSTSEAAACVEVSTLGAPVIIGSERALSDIKAAKPGRALYSISSSPLSPEAKAAFDRIDHGFLGNAPVREASWGFHIASLNAGGHRAVIARVAGRWRVVTRYLRWVA